MSSYPKIVEQLIERLRKLPGIGPKSAERIVNYLIKQPEGDVLALAEDIGLLRKGTQFCERCFNLADESLCSICRDSERKKIVCVVEEVKDLVILEGTGYSGFYHVLGGRISVLDNIHPEDLRISELVERVKTGDWEEIIIATNPNREGDDTAHYLSDILKKLGVKHSRLAYGLPVGAEIEYADVQTLKKSLEGRRPL